MSSIPQIKLKSLDEIHSVHDTLHAILHGELKEAFRKVHMDDDTVIALITAHEVCGWMIGCPCGKVFQGNIDKINEIIAQLKFRIVPNENQ